MASALFGWDLLIKSVESEIKTDEDVLLCLTHMVLISSGFKCIGLGDSKTFDGTEPRTETLPQGWSDIYALRYVFQGRLYNLKGTKLGDGVMFNLIRVDERSTSLLQLNNSSVARRNGPLEDMLPAHSAMTNLIKTQLIDKVVVSKKSREASSQTDAKGPSPLRSAEVLVQPSMRVPVTPRNVGELDLDPLAGRGPFGRIMPPAGGGMLFEPPRGPSYPAGPNFGLPPGAIPPGARFDPFRPPDVDRFPRRQNRPDNDEFPPPGYDDMFM